MAKKEAAPADGEENPTEGAEGASAEPKKGFGKILGLLKNKKVLFIGAPVLLLLLGGGGGAGYFFLLRPHPEDKSKLAAVAAPIVPPQVVFSDMDSITVNIQSSDGTPSYLKLTLSLELDNAEEKTAIAPLMARVIDQFQAYLRELRMDDLKGSAGVLRLKEELLRRANVAAAPYKIRDVLLKEMIVQ
ncbi:MAG TPA: flagellar basal body-associated FliL family protein [Rhizomicrobium sp.]